MDGKAQISNLEALNLSATLACISACEGTGGPLGYRALFGYRESRGGPVFDSFSDHPNVRASFKQTDGTLAFTTAAGRYQFIFATWKRIQALLRLPDFSPQWQDRAALHLIAERGALDDARTGRLCEVVRKCAPVWASLPSSKYLQPTRTLTFAESAFQGAGGVLAA